MGPHSKYIEHEPLTPPLKQRKHTASRAELEKAGRLKDLAFTLYTALATPLLGYHEQVLGSPVQEKIAYQSKS